MHYPDFSFERKLYKKGYKLIAGVDEVGRGCFAGPVVAGCVVFPAGPAGSSSRSTSSGHAAGAQRDSSFESEPEGSSLRVEDLRFRHPPPNSVVINDSKKLSPKQREMADKWIRKNALAVGIGKASVSQINRFGIKKASEVAFRKAIINCGTEINYLLIDAFYIPYVKGLRRKNQKPIIHGDERSLSIAAASIIAKVYRDGLMIKLSKNRKYKKYGWDKNKGYGTREHQRAIKKYGITRQHRKAFVNTWLNKVKTQKLEVKSATQN